MTSNSFQLCVPLSSHVSVRDAIDVIANPDLMRFWCEPITALVVTDHKGGSTISSSSSSSSSSSFPSSSPSKGQKQQQIIASMKKTLDTNEQFVYPNVDECADDVIVPPASLAKPQQTTMRRDEVSCVTF
jgi:hypothetical protein